MRNVSRPSDLPFFLNLIEHLAARGLTCPQPVRNRAGEALGRLASRPAAIVTFLDGMWIRRPSAAHCAAVGDALAKLHLAGADFAHDTAQCASPSKAGGRCSRRPAHAPTRCRRGSAHAIAERACACSSASWPRNLPQGVIHADLFPDNVFFLGDRLSGLIDFYFACTDALAYDVAICLNAWCFEADHSYNITKGRALLNGYMRARTLTAPEIAALPDAVPRRGAALSADPAGRLAGGAAGRAGQAEGPARILSQAALPPGQRAARGITALTERKGTTVKASGRVVIHTDGACSGNPGPGGWGAILQWGGHTRELKGGEAHTTNNRMELMAAIMALEALKRPCDVDLHTDSQYLRQGITSWIHGWKRNGWRTADRKPVKNADLWQRLDAAVDRHTVHWHWVRGHAGHDLNERADELAREAIAEIRAGAHGGSQKS